MLVLLHAISFHAIKDRFEPEHRSDASKLFEIAQRAQTTEAGLMFAPEKPILDETLRNPSGNVLSIGGGRIHWAALCALAGCGKFIIVSPEMNKELFEKQLGALSLSGTAERLIRRRIEYHPTTFQKWHESHKDLAFYFDRIEMRNVLHFIDPEEHASFMKKCHDLLCFGGKILISGDDRYSIEALDGAPEQQSLFGRCAVRVQENPNKRIPLDPVITQNRLRTGPFAIHTIWEQFATFESNLRRATPNAAPILAQTYTNIRELINTDPNVYPDIGDKVRYSAFLHGRITDQVFLSPKYLNSLLEQSKFRVSLANRCFGQRGSLNHMDVTSYGLQSDTYPEHRYTVKTVAIAEKTN